VAAPGADRRRRAPPSNRPSTASSTATSLDPFSRKVVAGEAIAADGMATRRDDAFSEVVTTSNSEDHNRAPILNTYTGSSSNGSVSEEISGALAHVNFRPARVEAASTTSNRSLNRLRHSALVEDERLFYLHRVRGDTAIVEGEVAGLPMPQARLRQPSQTCRYTLDNSEGG
jgi:hypothetical protein